MLFQALFIMEWLRNGNCLIKLTTCDLMDQRLLISVLCENVWIMFIQMDRLKQRGKRDFCKCKRILYTPIKSWKRDHVKIPTNKQFHQYQQTTNTSHLKSLNTKPITSYGVWNPGTGLSQSQKSLNG